MINCKILQFRYLKKYLIERPGYMHDMFEVNELMRKCFNGGAPWHCLHTCVHMCLNKYNIYQRCLNVNISIVITCFIAGKRIADENDGSVCIEIQSNCRNSTAFFATEMVSQLPVEFWCDVSNNMTISLTTIIINLYFNIQPQIWPELSH